MFDTEYVKDEVRITAQMKRIAKRLREERMRQNISQIDLSFKAGLSQNQVNYIETGTRTPNLYTLLSVCDALQINPAMLFEPYNTGRKKAREKIIQLVSRFM